MALYIISAVLFCIVQTYIVLSTRIYIAQELVFYPWLIAKGLLIYRDFNVQHGYFLHLLLVPFSLDKSLFLIKSFYIAIQTVNLLGVLWVLKKTTNKRGFLIGGSLFVLINYYLTSSNLWDETILASVYLGIYWFFIQAPRLSKKKMVIMGAILGAVSFMKPSFMIMAIPLILYSRSLLVLIPIISVWIATFVFFAFHGILRVFLDSYIFYNRFYGFGNVGPRMWSIEPSFINYTLFLLAASILVFFIRIKLFKKNPIALFVLLSLLLFFPSCTKINLVPFGLFLSIFIGQLVGKIYKRTLFLYLCIIAFYGIFIGHKTIQLYGYFKTNREPAMENRQIERIVQKSKTFGLKGNRVYVLSNQLQLYYYLDTLPPVWNVILWPVIISYYTNTEQRLMKEIKQNNVQFILVPKPLDSNYAGFTDMLNYIQKSYKSIYEDADFQMLKKIVY